MNKMNELLSNDTTDIIGGDVGGKQVNNIRLPIPPNIMTLDIAVHSRKEALEEGTILIEGIGENFYETVIHPFKKLAENRNMPMIKLIINSPGGSVLEAAQLCFLIRRSPVPVVAEVVQACSAAFVIATQCHYRIGYPASVMMYHLPWMFAEGDRHDMEEARDQLEHHEKILDGLIVDRCKNITKDILEEWGSNNEKWFTAKEALNYGALDHIVEDDYLVDPNPEPPSVGAPDPKNPTTTPAPGFKKYKKKTTRKKRKKK